MVEALSTLITQALALTYSLSRLTTKRMIAMKFNLNKISLVAALLVVLNGCETFVNQVDEFDPTRPIDASLSQVVNASQVAYIGFMEGDLCRTVNIFTNQFTGEDRQYQSLENYTTTSGDYDSQWDNIYAGILKSLRIVQDKARDESNLKVLAMAQIMEAHTIGMAASLWGDVPYSQIVKVDEFTNPLFDAQEDVYLAAIGLLDEAIANIGNSAAGSSYVGSIFNGGNAEWLARANTIKAKFYLHLGQYTNARTAALAGIASPAADLIATHGPSQGSNLNIFNDFLDWNRTGYMAASSAHAAFMLDPNSAAAFNRNNIKTNEEARFNYIYLDNFDIYNTGYECNFLGVTYYDYPEGYFGAEAPWHIVTYKENQLILAEAELRVNGFASALAELNELRAVLNTGAYINPDYLGDYSAIYLPYDAADFNAGGIENADAIAVEDALYREIIEEKYVSLLGHMEVFNDARRNGFGSFAGEQNWEVLGISLKGGNTSFPQRLLIAQSEINTNTSAPSPIPALFAKPEFPK
jgi:starch-binding outer membrane protein, SusD/RagB family